MTKFINNNRKDFLNGINFAGSIRSQFQKYDKAITYEKYF